LSGEVILQFLGKLVLDSQFLVLVLEKNVKFADFRSENLELLLIRSDLQYIGLEFLFSFRLNLRE